MAVGRRRGGISEGIRREETDATRSAKRRTNHSTKSEPRWYWEPRSRGWLGCRRLGWLMEENEKTSEKKVRARKRERK